MPVRLIVPVPTFSTDATPLLLMMLPAKVESWLLPPSVSTVTAEVDVARAGQPADRRRQVVEVERAAAERDGAVLQRERIGDPQRAGRDRGSAGVGVGRAEDQRARARLGDRSRAGDRLRHRDDAARWTARRSCWHCASVVARATVLEPAVVNRSVPPARPSGAAGGAEARVVENAQHAACRHRAAVIVGRAEHERAGPVLRERAAAAERLADGEGVAGRVDVDPAVEAAPVHVMAVEIREPCARHAQRAAGEVDLRADAADVRARGDRQRAAGQRGSAAVGVRRR